MPLHPSLTKHLSQKGKKSWIQANSKRKRKAKTGLNKVEKKQVKQIIATRKEFKYCPNWFAYDDFAATGGFIQSTIQPDSYLPNVYDANSDRAVSAVGFQTGQYLNTASTTVNTNLPGTLMYPLGGYSMLRGTGNNTIEGDYARCQSAFISLQINALPASGNVTSVEDALFPLEFRLIQIKAKRVATGTTPSLQGALFVDMTNDPDGLTMAGSVKEAMVDYRINTNQFTILRDMKFSLTQPVQLSYNGQTSNQGSQQTLHPSQRNFKFWLPKPAKKIRFSSTAVPNVNAHEPVNWDATVYTIILCSRKSGGTEGYSDTSRAWSVKATGMSKFRD